MGAGFSLGAEMPAHNYLVSRSAYRRAERRRVSAGNENVAAASGQLAIGGRIVVEAPDVQEVKGEVRTLSVAELAHALYKSSVVRRRTRLERDVADAQHLL
jgi:hypothetical protein